jgi:hypothetical protein
MIIDVIVEISGAVAKVETLPVKTTCKTELLTLPGLPRL